MQQSNQNNQNKFADKDQKQNLQEMNKSEETGNQSKGETGKVENYGKGGQNQSSDADEKTNVDQRSGDNQTGGQFGSAGQGSQRNDSGKSGVENSSATGQKQFDQDNDDGSESDKNMQSGRSDQSGKNSQSGSSGGANASRPSQSDSKNSR